MLTRHLVYFKLPCYTNPQMFRWFEENPQTYNHVYTLEANIIMLHRSFVTSLIMKAWVTCALDKSCIAPIYSRLWPCDPCGCHRYDQDALTIISTIFYGYSGNYPVFTFSEQEQSNFFEIKREETINYFV